MNNATGLFVRNKILTLVTFFICAVVNTFTLLKIIETEFRWQWQDYEIFFVLRSVVRLIAIFFMLAPVLFHVTRRKYKYVIVLLAICELLYALYMFCEMVLDDWTGIGTLVFVLFLLFMFLPAIATAFFFAFLGVSRDFAYISPIALSIYYALWLFLNRNIEFFGAEVAATVMLIIFMTLSLSFVEDNPPHLPKSNDKQKGIYYHPDIKR